MSSAIVYVTGDEKRTTCKAVEAKAVLERQEVVRSLDTGQVPSWWSWESSSSSCCGIKSHSSVEAHHLGPFCHPLAQTAFERSVGSPCVYWKVVRLSLNSSPNSHDRLMVLMTLTIGHFDLCNFNLEISYSDASFAFMCVCVCLLFFDVKHPASHFLLSSF
jgi:hypothetical protein